MERKFIARFFLTSKYISTKSAITTSSQGLDEHFCEAWERYKALLKKCPNHKVNDVAQLNMLYNGLRPQTRMLLDALAMETMMMKSVEDATTINESLVTSHHAQYEKTQPSKRGILELGTQYATLVQNKLIS